VQTNIRNDSVRTSRGISKDVWEARPYTRWEPDDPTPILEAYEGLAKSQVNFMRTLATQEHGGWIINRDWQKLLPPKGFLVLPRRWVVERTLSWIDQNRRMSKDYERLCASGEAFVYAAMIRLMTRRLARV
jgi:transposase